MQRGPDQLRVPKSSPKAVLGVGMLRFQLRASAQARNRSQALGSSKSAPGAVVEHRPRVESSCKGDAWRGRGLVATAGLKMPVLAAGHVARHLLLPGRSRHRATTGRSCWGGGAVMARGAGCPRGRFIKKKSPSRSPDTRGSSVTHPCPEPAA